MKQGWTYNKLGDICKLYQPHTISSKEMVDDGKYDVFGANGIIGKYNQYNHEEPEILMTCRGATCGNINVSTPKSWINGNAMVVHIKDEKTLNKSFLIYILSHIDKTHIITGAAQPQITRQTLSPLMIGYPTLPEQERIVERLDAAFAQIDELKSNAERQLAEARALFQSALTQAMQPKPGWDRKPLQELCLKRKIIKWEEVDDNVNFTYIDLSSVDRESLNIIGPQKINKNNAPSRAKQIVQMGDVIFATTRPTLRRLCLISKEFNNQICSTGYCVLRPNCAILSKWIYYSLQQDSFYHYIEPLQTGTSYPAVTDDMVKDYIVNLPTISVQSDIVSFLDQIDIHLKEIEEINRKTAAECDAMKQALLRQIFE